MPDNYWENKRRRERQKGKPVITRRQNRIEFNIDQESYIYEFVTNSNTGLAFVRKGERIIYGGPSDTEEGRRVYNLLKENSII